MPSAASCELLLNTAFVDRLHQGIAEATRRVYLQVMTFDGDDSGLAVADLLIDAAGRGVDVRIAIDMFAFRFISDIKYSKPEVAEEVAATHAMFDRMEDAGVAVTYLNPYGPLLIWGLFRNHKKIYVIDDVGYLGGINISDHNFEWLDFNIELNDSDVVAAIVDDFDATLRGEERHMASPIITNSHVEKTVFDLIDGATDSIVVASPYALDAALADRLSSATAPNKMVIAPERSNFLTFRLSDPYVRTQLQRNGIEMRQFRGFFHAKFLLIDGKTLLIGSSNFGRHSFRCNQEIAIVAESPDAIAAVEKLVAQTETVTSAASPIKYAIGAFVATVIRVGAVVVERVLRPHAPTLTTR